MHRHPRTRIFPFPSSEVLIIPRPTMNPTSYSVQTPKPSRDVRIYCPSRSKFKPHVPERFYPECSIKNGYFLLIKCVVRAVFLCRYRLQSPPLFPVCAFLAIPTLLFHALLLFGRLFFGLLVLFPLRAPLIDSQSLFFLFLSFRLFFLFFLFFCSLTLFLLPRLLS